MGKDKKENGLDYDFIVEEALKHLPLSSSKSNLEIGTGSGCIVLSVLSERKNCYANGNDWIGPNGFEHGSPLDEGGP